MELSFNTIEHSERPVTIETFYKETCSDQKDNKKSQKFSMKLGFFEALFTCKEGLTDPTTELEFSERKTTEDVPYLRVLILVYINGVFDQFGMVSGSIDIFAVVPRIIKLLNMISYNGFIN